VDTRKGHTMVEYLMFQNKEGKMLRIVAINPKFQGCATVYDTRNVKEWFCSSVIIESRSAYWTMRKFIMTLPDNITARSYIETMDVVGKVMPKFRVPHFDELITLEYKSMAGTLIRKNLLHIIGGKDHFEYTRTITYESMITPHHLMLTNIKSIVPDNAQENASL